MQTATDKLKAAMLKSLNTFEGGKLVARWERQAAMVAHGPVDRERDLGQVGTINRRITASVTLHNDEMPDTGFADVLGTLDDAAHLIAHKLVNTFRDQTEEEHIEECEGSIDTDKAHVRGHEGGIDIEFDSAVSATLYR